MNRLIAIVVALFAVMTACAKREPAPVPQMVATTRGEPDYSEWNRMLEAYYDPARGFAYGALKSGDAAALTALRSRLGAVDLSTLDRDQQLAYWINLYNVNTVGVVVDAYPIASIRDLSTDPVGRTNVFKKAVVRRGQEVISLDDVEHGTIRKTFRDPRVHFALNCASVSCPPLRKEAYTGARVGAQLDEQVRAFAAGPGLSIEKTPEGGVLRTTKIMDWFGEDFEQGGQSKISFLQKYLPAEKASALRQAGNVTLRYDDYRWDLNDWKR